MLYILGKLYRYPFTTQFVWTLKNTVTRIYRCTSLKYNFQGLFESKHVNHWLISPQLTLNIIVNHFTTSLSSRFPKPILNMHVCLAPASLFTLRVMQSRKEPHAAIFPCCDNHSRVITSFNNLQPMAIGDCNFTLQQWKMALLCIFSEYIIRRILNGF